MNNDKVHPSARVHDLSFVPAHRREAVRRRIAAIETFIKKGGRPAATLAAADLGMGVAQFYMLVRAWRAGCRPEELSGAGKPPAPRRRINDEQAAVIDEAAGLLPDESIEQIGELAVRIARERGVPMPSWAAIRVNIGKAVVGRVPPRSAAVGADIIVEHCAVNIGVEGHDGRGYMPIATIVTDVAARRVIAVALSEEWPTPSTTARALAMAATSLPISRATGQEAGTLFIETFPRKDWGDIVSALTESGLKVNTRLRERPAPDATHAIIGRRVRSVALHPKVSSRPSVARPARMQKGAAPVSLAEAEAYVAARLIVPVGKNAMMENTNEAAMALARKLEGIATREVG